MEFHAHVSDVNKEGGKEEKIERERKRGERIETFVYTEDYMN